MIMVRETRHLWIGNLPENVREEQIRDLFQRHGRVQSVKFLPDDSSTSMSNSSGGNGARTGKSATVAFIDIRSATKALRSVHSMAGQPLQITYHEPGSVPPRSIQPTEHSSPGDSAVATTSETGTNAVSSLPQGNSPIISGPGISNGPSPNASGPGLYRQQRFPIHGQSEESSSHFYEQPKGFSRGRGDGHGFHGTRGRREHRHPYHNNRHSFPGDRNYRLWGYPNEGRFAPPAHSEVDERTSGPSPSHPTQNDTSKGARRPDSPASSVSSRHIPSKRHKSRSVSESGSSDRGSSAGSRSRSGSRSSVSTSVSSGRSRSPPHHSSSGHYSSSRGGSPGNRFHQNSYSRQRYSRSRLVSRPADSSRVRHGSRSPLMAASPSSSASSSPSPHRKINAAPHSPSHSPSSAKSYSPSRSLNQSGHHHHHHHRRAPNSAELQSAIKIRNLPIRSSDTSLKDGLYHEYKKHGKVSWVRVIGTGSERFAIVCFKSSEHATRAVALSQDKQFFGCKIQVSAYYSSRGDEPLGGPDEDNRGLGDDEPSSVSYPTRTVLITGLDTLVTYNELKSAFDQYGDIVSIDIRKQGASSHAVCEFVDIASAIRAQWGRHMFKSREARISFYRAPPSSSLLLDGTDGVTEKHITGHCGQYGAISRIIMDNDRILALVHFDEISSAQAAIRELRSWVIKGKHLHADFASPECIRMFLERVKNGIGRGDNSSQNIRLSTTPPRNNSIAGINIKERRSSRRYIDCPNDERKSPYNIHRHTNDVEFEGTKPMTQLRMLDEAVSPESASSIPSRQNDVGSGDDIGSLSYHRRRVGFTSPVSPDPEHLNIGANEVPPNETSGLVKEHCKIDLSCHETDSAVVTSSSDVILAESDTHSNHENSIMNGDDSHSHYDFVRIGCNTNVSCMSHVAVTVDGVSSTSPEPKSEAVRKASPDPGIGLGASEFIPKIIVDPHIITTGLVDPRKKPSENKIRRSSADSGTSNAPGTSHNQHSLNGGTSMSSASSPYVSNTTHTNSNVNHSNHIGSEGGDDRGENDDRPGTPLCDENPESFVTTESSSVKLPSRNAFFSSKNEQPLSLPLPEFALHQRYSHYNHSTQSLSRHNSSKVLPSRDHMMAVRLSRSSNEATVLKSPIKSPVYDGGSSVMNSSANECDTLSPTSLSDNKTSSERHSNTRTILSSSSNASTNNNSWNDVESPEINRCERGEVSDENSTKRQMLETKDISVLNHSNSLKTEILDNETLQNMVLRLDSNTPDDPGAGMGSSSDSESGSSPRRSPMGPSLEQRIQKLYERYDQWNGIRTTVRSSTVPLHQGAMATLDNLGKPSSTAAAATVNESIEPPSPISRFVRTKPKVLDLDEMRHQPSDIVKSLLAKKSVFDEDTKRLENFGEKYEAKPASIAGGNWRLALNRSSSTTSNSSTASGVSNVAQTPPPVTPTTPNAIPTTYPSTPTTPSLPSGRSSQSGIQHPPSSSPSTHNSNAKSQHHNSLPHPVGTAATAGKSSNKDLNVSNPTPGGHRAVANSMNNTHGKSTVTKSTASSGSCKSTNLSTTTFSPLPNCKAQTDVVNKSSISSMPVTVPATSTGKLFNVDNTSSCGSNNTQTLSGSNNSRTNPTTKSSNLPNAATSSANSNPSGSGSAQAGMHQGIPRVVERSMSLDSKRSASQISHPNVSSSAGCSPNNVPNNASPSSATASGERPAVRRISADSHSAVIKDAQLSRKSCDSILDVSVKVVKDNPSSLTKEKINKTVAPSKDEIPSKNAILIKNEPLILNHNHSVETTVAVVATVQTPVLLSKDPKKDGREKKRRSSGSSTAVQNSPQTSSSSTTIKTEGSGATSSSTSTSSKPGSSSSNKDRKDKDNNKEPRKSPDDGISSSSNSSNNPHHSSGSSSSSSSSGSHHHSKSNKTREKVKEEKDHTPESNTSPSSTSKDTHSVVKKEKEKEVSKLKRRLSSQENEQVEPKKLKLEKKESQNSKDTEQPPNNHRSKHGSTSERRESRDSSSSAREKSKEKSEKDRESTKSESSVSSSSKDKDQHYKSKPSSGSSSSSSSSSKHHHHGDKEKEKSKSSTDGHMSSSYSHKSTSDTSKRKDKQQTPLGKDGNNGKSSKHFSSSSVSSNHSHGHHGSSKKESSNKGRSLNSKDNKSKEKHSSTAIESEEENESSVSNPVDKDKDRDKGREKGDKRDGSSKRDRHKSGGDSYASGGGENAKAGRKQEQKKKRRYVIDETETSESDEEEEKQKHHSIFDAVIIDPYVSMYDKVKARSNRACKNNPTPQQEQRKQEQFQQLKQSRAKREEKKRSTSIEERKSYANTSSDESHAHHDSDAIERDQSTKGDRERDRHREKARDTAADQTSDDESQTNHKAGSRSSTSKSHQKSKSRSLKGKGKGKGRRSNKASPVRGASFSSASAFFSPSDEDSHASSPPASKKRKLKHGIQSISHQSIEVKTSDESASDYESSSKPSSSKSKYSTPVTATSKSTGKANKLRTSDVFSDSDSSVKSSSRGNKSAVIPLASKNKSASARDKVGKQKSVDDIKKLFDDSSESSGGEEEIISKKVKEKEDASDKSRNKDKDSKGAGRKKHHSVASNKSSSSKGSRRQRVSSGDTASCDAASHASGSIKRETTNMKDIFGSMTPTSGSDVEEKPIIDERPKTPTPLVMPSTGPKLCEEAPVSSKSKSKKSKQRKSSSVLQNYSGHGSQSSVEDASMDSGLVTPTSTKSEKKKKKHHKRSKSTMDNQEGNISSASALAFDQLKVKTESVDLESLFNCSPPPSPKPVVPKMEPPSPPPATESVLSTDDIPSFFDTVRSQIVSLPDPLKCLKEREKPVETEDCDENNKSMFSTSEDDDDDDNELKIVINEAVLASDDQPDEPELDEPREDDTETKRRAEEEAEQDIAIKSIVDDRKTPPVVVEEEVNPKDEIPKDETAISQEETEDAVAALLETLEENDTINEEEESNLEKSASPPTIRIEEIEDMPTGNELGTELESATNTNVTETEKNESWYDTKSPKDLQIDEGAPLSTEMDNQVGDDPSSPIASDVDGDSSSKFNTTDPSISADRPAAEVEKPDDRMDEDLDKDAVTVVAVVTASRNSSRQGSVDAVAEEVSAAVSSTDVYEFHDSDEEKSVESMPQSLPHAKPTLPIPTIKSPPVLSNTSVSTDVMEQFTKAQLPLSQTNLPIPKTEAGPLLPLVSPMPSPIQLQPISKVNPPTVSPTELIPGVQKPIPIPPLSNSPTSVATMGSRTPPVVPVTRSTVDDTIEDVIRMVQTDNLIGTEVPAVIGSPGVQKVPVTPMRARSRSRSKDTPEDIVIPQGGIILSSSSGVIPSGTINKVILTKPSEGSPRRSNNNTPAPASMPLPLTPSIGQSIPPVGDTPQTLNVVKAEKDPEAVMEMIDPKTGILIPMMRTSDEYVPVMAQNPEHQSSLQLHQHHLQISLQSRTAEIISKAMERPSVLEKLPVSTHMQHAHNISQLHQNVALPKSEGLPAMLAQQQQMMPSSIHQQQKSHQMQQSHFQQSPQHVQQSLQQLQSSKTVVMSHAGPTPKANVVLTPSGPYVSPKLPFSSPVATQLTQQAVPSTSPGNNNVHFPSKPPGQIPTSMVKSSFTGQSQQHSPVTPNINYHHVTLVRPTEPPPVPNQIMQQRPMQQNLMRPQHNVQTQLVRIPQVPSATTITKINAGEDQQRKGTMMQPHPNVILTASSAATTSISGSVVRAVVPPAHPHQHAQQPVQIHEAELMRMNRMMSKDDGASPVSRAQESFGPSPRIDVGGSVVVAPAPSPKAGRVPQQHEQTPPPSTQQRILSQHHSLYDPSLSDVRVLSHVRQPTESSHYMSNQQSHPHGFPSHYIPASMGGSMGASMPQGQQSPYGMRSNEKMIQQPEKRGTPELHKGGATLTLINPERPPGVQSTHHIPPHLASPHQADQRGSESPLVATVYSQRHLYGTPVPAHQPPPSHLRQTFSNPYAELEEGRYSNSPSYHQFDPRVVEREREREIVRVPSPYASAGIVARRGVSPPPAHSRYGIQGMHPVPGAEAPSSSDRQRPTQEQTPPLGSQVPPQGDSLLMLLQRYPIMWQGLLALKNDNAACQMHFVSGNMNVARDSLPSQPDGTIPPLRISQRMRLEQTQLEGVARKMQMELEHCILLALPCGRDHMDVLQQSNNLRNGFITYLQLKQAAGIVNICHPITQQPAYVIHIFPSCDFANENLARIAPDLLHGVADIAHLLIVIATV